MHNYEFIQTINKDEYKDWFITVCFYIALHYVDAHAIFREIRFEYRNKDDVSLHIQRLRYVKSYIRPFFNSYKRLYEESRNSRYDPLFFKRFKGDLDKYLELALKFQPVM